MKRLEIKAKVAWTSVTRKEAGIEFLDAPEEVRLEIKEWLATDNIEPVYYETHRASESRPASPSTRKDKWTSLVSELTSIPAGIDRVGQNGVAEDFVTSGNIAPLLAETVATSAPPCELAASPLEPAPLRSHKELVKVATPPELALSEAQMADEKEPEIKPEFTIADLAEPSTIESAGIVGIGDPSYRKSDPDFSLPSDKLLNTPLRPIVVPSNRSNGATNGSRTFRDAPSSTATEDDFLKKARALFEPKGLTRREAEPLDAAVLAPAPAPALAPADEPAPILETPAEPEHAAAPPMSDLVATSSPVSEPVPLHHDNARGNEISHLPGSASSRPLGLPGFLSILALCVLLSAVCLVLGIIVGRNVATRSQNIASSHIEVPIRPSPQGPAVGQNDSSSSRSAPRSTLHRQSATDTERKSVHAQASRSRVESQLHARSTQVSPSDSSNEDAAENESTPQSMQNRSPDVSGTPTGPVSGIRVTPPAPAASNSFTAPPDASAIQHPQPPADRLVPAYPIYRVQPIYPRAAIQLGIEGTVKIHATIARDGTVKNLRVVTGPSVLSPAAIDAAQYWRYIPALRNGEPIETETDINIEFHLPR